MEENECPALERDRAGRRRAGRSSAAALSLLAPTGTGTEALVFSRSESELAATLSFFGSEVHAFSLPGEAGADETEGRPWALGQGSSAPLRGDARLPVDSASVDHVFLESGLGPLARGSDAAYDGPRLHAAFLAECGRILRPGGSLLLVEPNPFAPTAVLQDGVRGPLRAAAALWRPLARIGGPNETRTEQLDPGALSHRRLLRRSGFDDIRLHIPWPTHEGLRDLVCDAEKNRGARFRMPGRSRLRRAAGGVYRFLQRGGMHLPFVPELYVAGRKAGDTESDNGNAPREPSVLERILVREAPGAQLGDVVVNFRGGSGTMSFRTGARFIKIPLTEDALARQEQAKRALGRLASHRLAAHTLQSTHFSNSNGIRYSAAPFLEDRPSDETGRRGALQTGLRLMAENQREELRLSETATWERISCPPASSPWNRIGGESTLAGILRPLANRRIPAGISHGDFHEGNLLIRDDRLVIIDWDRMEEPAPLFLDGLSALCHRLVREESGSPDWKSAYLAAIDRLMTPDPKDPLTPSVQALTGELGWREAVAFYVVSYAHRWAESTLSTAPWDEAAVRSACRDRFELCASWLEASDG